MNPNWPSSILCPVDFSQPSAAALRFAANLAASTHAGLTLVHARFLPAPPYFTESQTADLSRQFKNSMDEADRALEEFATRLSPGCSAKRLIVDAAPVDAILKIAREAQSDLLVMGTHGRSGFNRFLLGSVAERILRESTVPVLTVRETSGTTAAALSIKRILCPVNDSSAAKHALQIAARLASSLNAELTALHVVEAPGLDRRPDLCNWLSEGERRVCRVQEIVESGDAADRILSTAQQSSSDVLVIGAQHRLFADATVLGTTTVRVVRHSPVPVLTVVNPARPAHD
jgi:nucleotide-binding universal stress UspA family protein